MAGAARCEPASLWAAAVPPAAALAQAAALASGFGEPGTFRGRGEWGPLDVAGLLGNWWRAPAGACLWWQLSEE